MIPKQECYHSQCHCHIYSEKGQVVILSTDKAIEMKGLDHDDLFPMQCFMNGVLIDGVPSFWYPFPVRPHMSFSSKTLSMPVI